MSDGLTVALDLALDDDLLREGRVYELIHTVNTLRKESGLELTDRIVVTLPASDADLVERHGEWIKSEVLAVSIEAEPETSVAHEVVDSTQAVVGATDRDIEQGMLTIAVEVRRPELEHPL